MKKLLKSKKGFTLVEVIVVLVILAILAAILIPSLTGYVDKANKRAVVAETRACVMAAQTLASEDYALKTSTCTAAAVKALAEVAGTSSAPAVANGKVTGLTYTAANGWSCTYTSGTYSDPTKGA